MIVLVGLYFFYIFYSSEKIESLDIFDIKVLYSNKTIHGVLHNDKHRI